jgi:uncharacterized protein YbjT (DUF2867 family)
MTLPTILITGATGKTGAAVVKELRAKGWPVRAVVHQPDVRSQALAKLGAEIVVADPFDPDQMLDALRGVQRAYYVSPFDEVWRMEHSANSTQIAASRRATMLRAV